MVRINTNGNLESLGHRKCCCCCFCNRSKVSVGERAPFKACHTHHAVSTTASGWHGGHVFGVVVTLVLRDSDDRAERIELIRVKV